MHQPPVHPDFGRELRSIRRALWLTASLAALFVGGTFLAPVLIQRGSNLGGLLHLIYSPTCHQIPERCLAVAGGVQAVCARCTGLYLGGLLALVACALAPALLRRLPAPIWLVIVAAPSVIDFGSTWIGAPGLDNLPRLLLAAPASFLAGMYLAKGIEHLVREGLGTSARADRVLATEPVLEDLDG